MTQDGMSRVLLYAPTPPPYAGPEVATNLLLRAMKQEAITVSHVRSNVREENVQKGTFDVKGILAFWRVYRMYLKRLKDTNPSKVYFLLSSSRIGFSRDAIILLTAKLLRKTVIAHYRGGNFHNFYAQQGPVLRWVIRRTLASTDCLIVQAEILRKIFATLIDPSKMRVLYNGIPARSPEVRARRGEGPFTLLFIGHIAFSKGFYELVLAYLILRDKYNVRFRFAGELRFSGVGRKSVLSFLSGVPRKYFTEHAEHIEHFINEFVTHAEGYGAEYLGVITGGEKQKAFAEADVLVLPSYTEGFSMSVLEAMSYGLPVVVTSVGALPEIVREGENGLFVEAGNFEDLQGKIERLILDESLAQRMGVRNEVYVKEQFNVETIAERFETILQEA